MKILLAPHADDETLFACYTLLREKPCVVLCLPGAERHGAREVRQAEFATAMKIVGCPWISLMDIDLEAGLRLLKPDHVWAPLPEEGGNFDHNWIGGLALHLWPGAVTFYTTYTEHGRTTAGELVEVEPHWLGLKRAALSCYKSQLASPGTRDHFFRAMDEFSVTSTFAKAKATA